MRKLHEALNQAEAHMIANLLAARGLEAEVRGEALFTTMDGGPAIPSLRPSVWLHHPEDQDEAARLLDRYLRGEEVAEAGASPWECPGCREPHEPQFGACWNCGTPRPA